MNVVTIITEHHKEHFDQLARKAGRILRDHAFGQDATQESYEAAWRYIHTFDPEKGEFAKWFNKIYWRTISRYKAFSAGQAKLEPLYEWEVSPKYAQAFIEDSTLSNDYKAICQQIYVNGYSPKELSLLMGKHSTSVIYKALHLFREEIKERNAVRSRRRGEQPNP
jgi:DNA-directed RNA polymerase specialized sigma24 family protein